MKALQISNGQVKIKEIGTPFCGESEIIIDMRACGICGSDIGNIFGESCKPTKKIGHELTTIH